MNPLLIAGIVGIAAYFWFSQKKSGGSATPGTLTVPTTVIPGSSSVYPATGPTYATVNLSDHDIRYIQTELTALGYGPVPVDGLLGPDTAAAVRQFQAANGLAIDGVIGPNTWDALQNAGGVIVDQTQTSGLAETAVIQAMGMSTAGSAWRYRGE
jgi:peptidoglycan hydrolase-like protein with peptidoglycan-binding domain